MTSLLDNVLKYLPIGAVALGGAVAWGAQQAELKNLKDVQIQQQQQIGQFQELDKRQVRIDERTQSIKENQQRQEDMLRTIIERLQ